MKTQHDIKRLPGVMFSNLNTNLKSCKKISITSIILMAVLLWTVGNNSTNRLNILNLYITL